MPADNADDDGEKQAKKEILQKMGGPISLGKGFVDYARHKFNLSQLKSISASAVEYGNGGFTLVSVKYICYLAFISMLVLTCKLYSIYFTYFSTVQRAPGNW